jgi:hypothetical protein
MSPEVESARGALSRAFGDLDPAAAQVQVVTDVMPGPQAPAVEAGPTDHEMGLWVTRGLSACVAQRACENPTVTSGYRQ